MSGHLGGAGEVGVGEEVGAAVGTVWCRGAVLRLQEMVEM